VSEKMWEKLPNGPEPRWEHSLILYKDCIYIFGGTDDRYTYFTNVLKYTILENKWEILESDDNAPCANDNSVVLYKDKAIVFGGYCNTLFLNELHEFDFTTFSWKKLQPIGDIPCGRFGHSSVIYKDYMYVFGGTTKFEAADDFYKLDISSNKFIKIDAKDPPMNTFRHYSFIYKDFLYIYSGYSAPNFYKFDLLNEKWIMIEKGLEHLLCDSEGRCAIVFQEYLYDIVGKDIKRFNLLNERWETIEGLGLNVLHACAIIYKNSIFVYGGINEDSEANSNFNKLQILEEKNESIYQLLKMGKFTDLLIN
jgi:N-acetylneuraminic acid mutarotase